RESSPWNRRTVEFRGARLDFQAPPLRSRVSWGALLEPRLDTQKRVGVTPIRVRASLTFARTGFYFDGHHGLIVERIHARGVLGDRFEDLVYHAVRRLGGAAGDDYFHTLRPKRLPMPVAGVENAVAVEHEEISGLGPESEFVVLSFVEQAERQAGGLDELNLAVVTIDGPRQARIRYQKGALLIVPHGVDDRNKLRLNPAF